MLSHDKPSYFYYTRSRTFDPDKFPPHVKVTTAADRTSDATEAEKDAMCREMKRRVLEINSADPTAVFGLYVDDLRCRIGYDWFVAQGIDSARVKVSLLSDGTATYNNFYNYFGDPATAQQNWDAYAAEVEALDWNHGGRYPETRAEFELESWTWPYYLATRPGYRLVMQNGSLLESSCPFITDKLREMQIEDIQPYEMLSTLPESARRLFYDMAGFDYDKFAALFDASPKGNLIIIGTSHQNAASEQQQRDCRQHDGLIDYAGNLRFLRFPLGLDGCSLCVRKAHQQQGVRRVRMELIELPAFLCRILLGVIAETVRLLIVNLKRIAVGNFRVGFHIATRPCDHVKFLASVSVSASLPTVLSPIRPK